MELPASDSDQDDLSDAMELYFGTDPLKPDTDGDSFSDGQEVQNGFNPLGEGELE
ncbi:MAG TPA: calcium-binding protein [Candidatus Jacksonbacteria bacterium]|nr:calcium-binding protein [Candidatus Jacksonbacteria bacterium]HCC50260.1 calcium-binding protein [Candidatus Jacksonbacteria bacterium]HCE48681.1 calcium-binding protein [Candidatus Jacksonbacteria bacterium]HCR15309.1 calcium-binding protein [Candidatus Jacksonbacteria bacterium]